MLSDGNKMAQFLNTLFRGCKDVNIKIAFSIIYFDICIVSIRDKNIMEIGFGDFSYVKPWHYFASLFFLSLIIGLSPFLKTLYVLNVGKFLKIDKFNSNYLATYGRIYDTAIESNNGVLLNIYKDGMGLVDNQNLLNSLYFTFFILLLVDLFLRGVVFHLFWHEKICIYDGILSYSACIYCIIASISGLIPVQQCGKSEKSDVKTKIIEKLSAS